MYPEESVAAFLRKKLEEVQQNNQAASGSGEPARKKERTHALITERQVELLFNGGETVSAIAALSGLAEATIEEKICSCIRKGPIPVENAVSKEKGRAVISAIMNLPGWNVKRLQQGRQFLLH